LSRVDEFLSTSLWAVYVHLCRGKLLLWGTQNEKRTKRKKSAKKGEERLAKGERNSERTNKAKMSLKKGEVRGPKKKRRETSVEKNAKWKEKGIGGGGNKEVKNCA